MRHTLIIATYGFCPVFSGVTNTGSSCQGHRTVNTLCLDQRLKSSNPWQSNKKPPRLSKNYVKIEGLGFCGRMVCQTGMTQQMLATQRLQVSLQSNDRNTISEVFTQFPSNPARFCPGLQNPCHNARTQIQIPDHNAQKHKSRVTII